MHKHNTWPTLSQILPKGALIEKPIVLITCTQILKTLGIIKKKEALCTCKFGLAKRTSLTRKKMIGLSQIIWFKSSIKLLIKPESEKNTG